MARILRPATAFQSHGDTYDPDSSPTYLTWVRKLPCAVCGEVSDVIAHHVRLERSASGVLRGVGKLGDRVSDFQTIPLRSDLHLGFPYSLHSGKEADWWKKKGIDPLMVCGVLNAVYHAGKDVQLAAELLSAMRGRYVKEQQS